MRSVTIVGGGIGGLASAAAFARLEWDVTVLEGASEPTPGLGGAFLNLAPNGMAALSVLGVADQVADAGFHSDAIVFRNHRGRDIGRLDSSDDCERFGHGNRMLRRADLHDILLHAAQAANVEVVHDCQVVDVDESDDDVLLHLADGTTRSASLVIGADGVHSRLRRHVVGRPVELNYLGLVDVAGFASVTPDGLPVGRQVMWFGRRSFFAAYVTPTGETWWFANLPRRERPTRHQLSATSPDSWIVELQHLHADDPAAITDILDVTDAPVGAWPTTDLPTLDTWHTPRVCLIGDAAHATSPSAGQGAALALEDAVELPRAVLSTTSGAEDAFATFERSRRPRVQHLVASARRNTNTKAPGPIGRAIRDLFLPLFLRLGARDASRAHAYQPPALPRT